MIEVGSLVCYVCIAYDIEMHSWLLGHHALKCVIDGPTVEGHATLSPLHDRESGHAYIALNFLAMHCLPSAAVKNRFCRKLWPSGRMPILPTGYSLLSDGFTNGR